MNLFRLARSLQKTVCIPHVNFGIRTSLKHCRSISSIYNYMPVRRHCFTPTFAAASRPQVYKWKTLDFPDMGDFKASFQIVYDDLIKETDAHLPEAISKRLGNVLKYNVLGGKCLRGMTVNIALKFLSNTEPTSEDYKLVFILGWCVEMLQAFFLINDDIMDNGITRRGKDCWFRMPDVGLQGLNDALIVQSCIYHLLKKYFSKKECYEKLLDEFLTVTRTTVWGQCLDMQVNPFGQKPQFELFNINYYSQLIEYKTAHYTFCLPLFLAMHYLGHFDPENYKEVKHISLKFGKLFQIQDDFLDVYGEVKDTGKKGTDIENGKCTWFAVTALEDSSNDNRKIMEENYGVKDRAATQKVLRLYDSMMLKDKYIAQENLMQAEIDQLISKMDNDILNHDLFVYILKSLYGRHM